MTEAMWMTGAWFAIVVSVAGFSYWAACRINDGAENARLAADHAMDAANDAHRGVTILREWWSEAVLLDPPDRPQITEPMPVQRTDTAEAAAVMGRIDDVVLAYELARLEDQLFDWRHRDDPPKPAPKPRPTPRKRAAAAKRGAA